MLGMLGMAFIFDSGDDTTPDGDSEAGETPDIEETLDIEDTVVEQEEAIAPGGTVDDPVQSEPLTLEGVPFGNNGPEYQRATIVGTQGDDFVTNETVTALLDASDTKSFFVGLDLGAGDDFAELDVSVGSGTGLIVNSGSGDDTIGVAEFWSEVRGDDGDDLLTSFGASALYGGAGDDTLSVAVGGFSHDGALVSGGDGDDVLDVYHTLGEDNGFDNAETEMRGGAGSDQFNINLFDGVEPTVDLFLEEITLSSDIAQVRITDFVAGEDALAVDVSSFKQNGKFELDDVGLEDFEAADVPSFCLPLRRTGVGSCCLSHFPVLMKPLILSPKFLCLVKRAA